MLLEGIAQLLAATVPELAYDEVSGGNVFLDDLPTAPNRAVGVYSLVAQEPDSKLPYDPAEFQLIVRSEASGQAWIRGVLEAAYSELQGKRNVTLPDGTYLVYCIAAQASPTPLGVDEANRPRFSQNYRTEIINYTRERPGQA